MKNAKACLNRRCAYCMVGWSLLAGLVLSCWPAFPAAGADATGPDLGAAGLPEIIDRGAATPKALLESMAELVDQRTQPQMWLGFQPPTRLDLAKTQLELARQLGAKASNLAELVQARIGKTEAGMVRSMQPGVQAGWELILRQQLSQIVKNGRVDWDKAKIVENGDKAEVAVGGQPILLAKVNGKWYIGEDEGQDTLAKDIVGIKEMTAASLKILDQTEQKIKSGQITKANFIQEYVKLVNENMGPGRK